MNPIPSVSQSRLRQQQQQPQRIADRRQQQSSGSQEFQPEQAHPGAQQGDADKADQMGEGSYEGTRDYQNNIESYLKTADVKADAKAAKPTSLREELELQKAEKEALAHSKAPGQ